MKLKNFLEEYEDIIELLEIIGENYYYSCEKIDKIIIEDNKVIIENMSIILEDVLQIKEEVNNGQKIYIYLYKDFALKFTMKKIVKLIDLLRYRKSEIQKIEVIGDGFYYPCTDNSDIIIKEDTKPIMLSLGKFILTLEKEELLKGILEKEDNIYVYDCKNFELRIVTTKVIRPIRKGNPWENLKNILKL